MNTHPQINDLVEAIRRFRGPGGGLLVVYEPTTQARMDFSHEPEDGQAENFLPGMECTVYKPVADRQADAAALGLRVKRTGELELRFGPRRGERQPYTVYRCGVTDDDGAAARACVAALRRMFDMPAGAWLWISADPEPDGWPTPLPKPAAWRPP